MTDVHQEGVMESALVHHMAKYLLDARFSSVKEMAAGVDVPYRALLRVFHHVDSPRDTQMIMNAIAAYCLRERIPPETLFKGFCLIG